MKKTYIYMTVLLAAGCSRMNELEPQGGIILSGQLQEVNTVIPSRADAAFNGMYTKLGVPGGVTGGTRPDDFGFVMMAFSNDIEAADIVLANSGYNWFSACGLLTSRNADYANPYIRYAAPYNTIAAANEILNSYSSDNEDPSVRHKLAQAHAMRAFAYMNLAPYFQFGYIFGAEDEPCVPIVTETTEDFTDNPRASVREVYSLIISDLTYAIDNLEDYVAGRGMTKKTKVRIMVTVTLLMSVGFIMMDAVPVGRMVLAGVWVFHMVYFLFGVKTIPADGDVF